MRYSASTILGLAILQAWPAGAAGFAPVSPLGSIVLDLDTQSGNFSIWRVNDASALNAIRATLKVHRLGTDPRWAPGFSISLRNGDDTALFQVLSTTRQPPLTMHLQTSKGGKTVEDQNFTTTIALDEKLEVSVDWTADGTVSVQAGAEKHVIALGEPIRSLEFSGSTGEVEYNPLAIGRSPP